MRAKIFLWALLSVSISGGCGDPQKDTVDRSLFEGVEVMVLYDVDPMTMSSPFILPKPTPPSYQVASQRASSVFEDIEPINDVLWKGSCLAEVRCTNGTSIHLMMSYYGGFFKILENGHIYKTRGASRKQYDEIFKAAIEEVFVPARKNEGLREKTE